MHANLSQGLFELLQALPDKLFTQRLVIREFAELFRARGFDAQRLRRQAGERRRDKVLGAGGARNSAITATARTARIIFRMFTSRPFAFECAVFHIFGDRSQ